MPQTMQTGDGRPLGIRDLIRRHPVLVYFAMTYAISWAGALLVAAPHLHQHQPLPVSTGILMFPAMLLGPSQTGIVLTAIIEGKSGVRGLFRSMVRFRVPRRWYAVLLLPPALILAVLFGLRTFVSPVYTPNLFYLGFLFGVPAGILEEVGWMGFAFPKMKAHDTTLAAGVKLGLLWSCWHLPVINFLGTAVPHGRYWLPFFFVFAAAMTAMRVVIVWLYSHTQSLGLAQCLHISSTGSLVVFSAAHITAGQEVFWYGIYALNLWAVVGEIVRRRGGE